ncbi:DUF4232 domain-containing protein [Streptomyces sp. NPDC001832]|uniref:DUF4232 domain-containing protein n=1 Tax=Streptomyces sp. NPDC001832 TaxID=3154527 RepID=UPI00331DCBFF
MRSNRIRTTVLAATALLAALSLTACSDNASGDSSKAGAAAPAGSTTDQQSPAATTQDTGKGSKDTDSATSKTPAGNTAANSKVSTSGTGGQKSNTSATGNSSSSPVTCTGDNTKVTVSKVSRPINHLLLTATNTASRPCYAYHAPALRFDDAQAAFPVLRDSKPQAVVTLQPGESAYASIGLFGESDGKDLNKSEHLTVYFTGRNDSGSTGSPAELTLPADTYWGNNGFVTYWQSDMADALTY